MNKEVRHYIQKIKINIAGNITYIKKRLSIFPKKTIMKIGKMKLDKPVNINGHSYSSDELTKTILAKYKELVKETSTLSYKEILRSFIKESKTSDNINHIYEKYQKELRERLEKDKNDLYFCLDSLKAMEKLIKE